MVGAWLARENIRSGCSERIGFRWIQDGSSKQLTPRVSSTFVSDTPSQIPARTGRNISISIVGSKLIFAGFVSLNSICYALSASSILAVEQSIFSTLLNYYATAGAVSTWTA